MMKTVSLTTCALVLSISAGCGGGAKDMPEIGTVSGKLTLDGVPVAGADISFYPLSGGRTAVGASDDQGHYTLQYNSSTAGAKVGQNQVTITTFREAMVYGGQGEQEDIPGRAEEIPAKYASEKLKVNVEPGSNTIDLTLTSE